MKSSVIVAQSINLHQLVYHKAPNLGYFIEDSEMTSSYCYLGFDIFKMYIFSIWIYLVYFKTI